MEQIQSLLESVLALIPCANIGQLSAIIQGIYSISSGGVTQLNISRYSSISYRGVNRFMSYDIVWRNVYVEQLKWYIGSCLKGQIGDYLLVIDETVEDKSGKETHKIGYFFCSKAKKAIKSVSFAVMSVVSVSSRKSYVVDFEQLEQDKEKAAANKEKKAAAKAAKAAAKQSAESEGTVEVTAKKKGGRPVGATTKSKGKTDSVGFKALELLLKRVLPLLLGIGIAPCYLIGDGAYGNLTGCLIAREQGLHLISKLHYNMALYHLPIKGTKKRKYGQRIDFANLGDTAKEPLAIEIQKIEDKEGILTCFQIKAVQTEHIEAILNVVVVRYLCLKTNKCSYCVLFSTDLELDGLTLMDYYTLRFQIEFNFRDAKQFFGLSDFKSIKEIQVRNSVGLSFFMVNLSDILLVQATESLQVDSLSIQDLKAHFRAVFYAKRLKNTPDFSVPSFSDPKSITFLANLGAVNLGKKQSKTKKVA
jgi:putative transposase